MIDLTPLDVRKKRGDFRKGIRGYESQEVDTFLDLVAERLEELVRENMQLRERTETLQQQTASQTQREEAVRDALVTAQELRAEIREQARTESDRILNDARTEARRLIAEAEAEVRTRLRNSERQADHAIATLGVLERRRLRFLQTYRQLLEREMDVVEVEEGRPPLEERSFDLDFGSTTAGGPAGAAPHASPAVVPPGVAGSDPHRTQGGTQHGVAPDGGAHDARRADPRLDQSLDELYQAALEAVEDDRDEYAVDPAVADPDARLDAGPSAEHRNENVLFYLEPEEPADE